MCEVLWPHTHVMVDVPCGYSFLFVNQYRVLDISHVDFDRLGTMIKSVASCDHWKLKIFSC